MLWRTGYSLAMSSVDLVERLLGAAFQQGGERLELRSGQPAIMVRGGERLKAGGGSLDGAALLEWWQTVSDQAAERALGLSGTAVLKIERSGRPVRVTARQVLDQVGLEIDLTGQSPPAKEAQRPGRKAPPARGAAKKPTEIGAADRPVDRLLREIVALGASDLHLSSGVVPHIRLHGEMMALPGVREPLGSDLIQMLCDDVAPAKNRGEFRDCNDTDFAYQIDGLARFRVNMFRDRKGVGVVFRQIPTEILSMEQLGVPDCVRDLCMLSKGLVVVTGPTGSGKSTTLAAMIDYLNENRSDHVITIEDPVEFVHQNKRCLVNQREVYSDTTSFKRALRAALREDPDVILVGEMRDLETIAIAIETAETGHLVLGTLHTTTAISTVDRIIDQFPADRQEQVRMMMADCLKGVIAQVLCRRREGGRVAAYEVLLGVHAVSNLIREAKSYQLASVMQTSRKIGMRTLNDSLAELVKTGVIDIDEALSKSVDKEALRSLLRGAAPPSPA